MAGRELGDTLPEEGVSARDKAIIYSENSHSSREPGMTVFVTAEAAERITQESEDLGYEPIDVTPVIDGVMGVRYPDGYFTTLQPFEGPGGIRVYQHAGPLNPSRGDRSIDGATNKLHLDFSEVIRIEGSDGATWQNWNYPEIWERVRAATAKRLSAKPVSRFGILAIPDEIPAETGLSPADELKANTLLWKFNRHEPGTSLKVELGEQLADHVGRISGSEPMRQGARVIFAAIGGYPLPEGDDRR